MTIKKLIEEYKISHIYGTFELKKDEIINEIIKKNKVPNSYGIYIIYSIENLSKNIIYIGRAGTMINDGTLKSQGISNRLKNRQNKLSRKTYFQNVIEEYRYNKLEFLWITTFDENHQEIPSFSESKMIQAYFNQNKELPLLNKEA